MSVILINYTYVHDVMRIWQGPEARPDREFIFPEEGHVNCFQVQESRSETRYAQEYSSALHRS